MSFLAALSILGVGIINPVVVPLAKEFNITPVLATYTTTVALGTGSLGPLIFTPFANVYGRRPVYLISVLIGVASAVGAATATPLLENLWSHGHLLGWGLQPGHSR